MNLKFFAPMLLLVASAVAFAQQDFSADIVNTKQDKMSTPGKMYVTKDKMRFEPENKTSEHFGAMILDWTTHTSYVLMPERKMYLETSSSMGPSTQRSWSYFRAINPDNACGDWLKVAKPGTTCKKIGSDTVNGRSTIKYEGAGTDGDVSTVWIDPKIAFPIKWQNKSSSGELQNIKEGSLSSSLFEIPSDYQKMQMPMGMPQNMPHQ